MENTNQKLKWPVENLTNLTIEFLRGKSNTEGKDNVAITRNFKDYAAEKTDYEKEDLMETVNVFQCQLQFAGKFGTRIHSRCF